MQGHAGANYLPLVASNRVGTEKGAARIDLQTLAAAATFTDAAIKSPFGCAVSPDGAKLYLMDRDANQVFVFATATHELLKSIAVPEDPRQAVFTPDGRSLVVSCGDAATLAVIDPASDTVTRKIKAASLDPRNMLITPDGKYLVVALVSSDLLSWYRADTLEYAGSFGVTRSPQALVVTSDAGWIYAGGALGDIGAVNAREHMANGTPEPRQENAIHVGAVYSLTSTPDGDYLYAAPTDGNGTVVEMRSWKVSKPPALKGAAQLLYVK